VTRVEGATEAAEVGALVRELRAGLAAAADPAAAPAMQAYMKSDLPYYGVRSAGARAVFSAGIAAHPLPDRAAWLAAVRRLWDEATHREELYAALAVLRDRRYAEHRDPDVLPVYRHVLVTGAWWDVVDDAATHLVGPLLLAHPAAVGPVLRAWAVDEDRWLRRTAVIAQLLAKDRTDLDLLTTAIDANLDDRDFFLRKAIGWALRQYARTDPDWVRAFVAERGDRLSPLSRREALKHLGSLGDPSGAAAPA
jgi:3-methyladenine DNA glycosylase AlkD